MCTCAAFARSFRIDRKHSAIPDFQAWLRDLSTTTAELSSAWDLEIGESLSGGTEAFVVAARTAEGEEVVLKIALPDREPDREASILIAAGGRGYVRVLRHDARRSALLLERLGPQVLELDLSVDAQIAIVCRALAEAWKIPPPAGVALPTGADKARRLAAIIEENWDPLGRPCSERAVERALSYAESRAIAFDPRSAVLAHGDAHGWNTLQDPRARDRFKLIDPDGLFAERAYDLSISMREWSADLLTGDTIARGRERCALLSRLGGVAPEPIWQWALLERVSNGLLLAQIGWHDVAAECLRVADAWALAQ